VGNVVNVGLTPQSGSAEFRAAWGNVILPRLQAFNPDLIVVSAGEFPGWKPSNPSCWKPSYSSCVDRSFLCCLSFSLFFSDFDDDE
jgi:hypothetical protein